MTDGISALAAAAVSIGLIHTLAGPDHYVPFVAMARAGRWSLKRTLVITALCGIGHVGSSVVLGFIGVALGIGVESLNWFESARGELAAWLLIAFGLTYLTWGVWRGLRNKPHAHIHLHADGTLHTHVHSHNLDHRHVHEPILDESGQAENAVRSANISPWVLFTIFVFGPCEPLIPLIMYPAALHDRWAVALVTGLFAVVTVGTMLALVGAMYLGLGRIRLNRIERFGHALAGGAVLACGLAVKFGL